MYVIGQSDFKSSIASFFSMGGLLASAVVVQQYSPENMLILPLFLSGLFAVFFLGFWGWSAFGVLLAGIAAYKSAPFLAVSFASYLLSSLILLLISKEKKENGLDEKENLHRELALQLKRASLEIRPKEETQVPAIVRQVVVESEIQETVPLQTEVTAAEASYRELQKQFKEKSQVLHDTRKELFALEGRYLLLQKEYEEALLENPIPALWQKEVFDLIEEKEALFKENQVLQEIISNLSEKKKVTPSAFSLDEVDEFFSFSKKS